VPGLKYGKLINIVFTGEYEFDDEPVMDEELATEGIASLNIRLWLPRQTTNRGAAILGSDADY
jgi:hypothetical protein